MASLSIMKMSQGITVNTKATMTATMTEAPPWVASGWSEFAMNTITVTKIAA
jgi:hypothetical protein